MQIDIQVDYSCGAVKKYSAAQFEINADLLASRNRHNLDADQIPVAEIINAGRSLIPPLSVEMETEFTNRAGVEIAHVVSVDEVCKNETARWHLSINGKEIPAIMFEGPSAVSDARVTYVKDGDSVTLTLQ